jgi:eukaryotic-like serine/threonine-protein kinase
MAVGELQPPNTDDPLVGTVLSERYRIHKKLGEGGMGAVYLAEHVFIEKKVALKVLAPELSRKADLTQRFLQEAKSASRIGHENVIDISDFGQSPEGLVYFAMEYLPGHDLGHALRDGAMPWSRAKPIIIQICKALRAAHNKGIIHRDMKPENVFLIAKGGTNDFVKLLDFGIAKVQGLGDDAPKLTQTGMIFGTPEYMAPEQAEGKVCDLRADLYAVGCVLYHMIAGQAPFQADSFMAMLTKHLLEEPIKPSKKRPDLGISPALDAIVMKALRKNRDERWKDMDDMLAQLEAVPVDAVGTVSSAAPEQPKPIVRGAETRQMGGGDAMPIITTTPRVSNTAMLTVGPGQQHDGSEFEDADLSPRPTKKSNNGILIAAGLLVGGAIAVAALVFGGGKPETTVQPSANQVEPTAKPSVAPTPDPAPVAKIPEPPIAPVPTPVEPTAVHHSSRKHDKPAKYKKIDLDESEPAPAMAPPPTKIAPELKGFPGQ